MDKIMGAALKYLEGRGFEILDEAFDGYIAAIDTEKERTVLVKVVQTLEPGRFDDELGKVDRAGFEKLVIALCTEYADRISEGMVALDVLNFSVVNGNRAVLQHHRNAPIYEED